MIWREAVSPHSFASQILDHIRSNDLARGQHLPSQALADACRVSRAPINSAFSFWRISASCVSSRTRGYFLAADANKLAALKLLADEEGDEERGVFRDCRRPPVRQAAGGR